MPARLPQRRSRLRAGAIVAFAALVMGLTGALAATAPASAASPGVLLSSDGVTFASAYPGTLFDGTSLMVPRSTQSARFWVKNASAETAFLRVSIGSVSGAGTSFSGALTVRASTSGGGSGPDVPVDAALPCHVLTQGRVLAPGAVVRVDATLALGDLAGTAGQQAAVRFDILAGLSSAATGSMPDTACLVGSGTVPGTPGSGTGSGTGGGGAGGGAAAGGGGAAAGGGAGGTLHGGAPPALGAEASGVVALPGADTPGAFAGGGATVGILRSNTGRLHQEWFVLMWIAGTLVGGGAQVVVARRRLDEYEHEYEYEYDEFERELDDIEEEEVATWVDGRIDGRRAWSTT